MSDEINIVISKRWYYRLYLFWMRLVDIVTQHTPSYDEVSDRMRRASRVEYVGYDGVDMRNPEDVEHWLATTDFRARWIAGMCYNMMDELEQQARGE